MPGTVATTVRAPLTKFQKVGRDVARDMVTKRLTAKGLAGISRRNSRNAAGEFRDRDAFSH